MFQTLLGIQLNFHHKTLFVDAVIILTYSEK